MRKIIHSHPTIVIGTLVLVFVAVIVLFYAWAIGDAVAEIDQALAPPTAESSGGFDLSAASKLDLRGLINTSSPQTGASGTY
jgi:hypothetical protein